MEEKKQVYITLTDYYRTFDGGDNTAPKVFDFSTTTFIKVFQVLQFLN